MRILFSSAMVLTLLLLPGANNDARAQGGTFSLPINDDPQIWPLTGGLFNILVNKVVYSSLVRYDLETLAPVGDLAEDWGLSEDGLTYTFNLRQGVTWHDGEPFDAEDVVFTMGLWTDPDVPFYLARNFRMVDSIEQIDSHTIAITLKRAQPAFPVLLGYNTAILPEHLLSGLSKEELTNPDEFLRNPVGTGPYRFAEYNPGSFVRLTRNEDYFAGMPKLDAMVFRIVPDSNSQLALLQSGQLDLVIVEPFQLPAVENNPNVRIQSMPITRHEYIALNNGFAPLNDVRVRRALTIALDREQLLETVFAGRGSVATGPFPPTMGWARDTSIEPLPYDPEKAAGLLDEAGWILGENGIREKDGEPLSFTVLYDPANQTRARTALIAQQQWGEIGVTVEFETSEYRPIVARIRQSPPDYQINPNYLITPPDPDGVANFFLSDSLANSWAYQNPQLDDLLNAGATAIDQDVRADAYKQAQQIIHDDQPNVFTVFPDEIQALGTGVEFFPQAGYRDALAWSHLISKN